MTRRRWIADEFSENHAALVGEHAQHLSRVLRARVGQEFDVSAGDTTRQGRVVSVSDDRVEFELGEAVESVTLPNITLLMAIFKFDRMEWAIEKCTELGVAGIVPVVARRTDVHLATAAPKRVERWIRITNQASEQARRVVTPRIERPLKVKEAVLRPAALRVLLSESEDKLMLADALQDCPSGGDILLAIGPEGGWSDDEMALFAQNGWKAASLGNTILRAETAAIAATAIAFSELTMGPTFRTETSTR